MFIALRKGIFKTLYVKKKKKLWRLQITIAQNETQGKEFENLIIEKRTAEKMRDT